MGVLHILEESTKNFYVLNPPGIVKVAVLSGPARFPATVSKLCKLLIYTYTLVYISADKIHVKREDLVLFDGLGKL